MAASTSEAEENWREQGQGELVEEETGRVAVGAESSGVHAKLGVTSMKINQQSQQIPLEPVEVCNIMLCLGK